MSSTQMVSYLLVLLIALINVGKDFFGYGVTHPAGKRIGITLLILTVLSSIFAAVATYQANTRGRAEEGLRRQLAEIPGLIERVDRTRDRGLMKQLGEKLERLVTDAHATDVHPAVRPLVRKYAVVVVIWGHLAVEGNLLSLHDYATKQYKALGWEGRDLLDTLIYRLHIFDVSDLYVGSPVKEIGVYGATFDLQLATSKEFWSRKASQFYDRAYSYLGA